MLDGRVRLYRISKDQHGRITAWLAGIDLRRPITMRVDGSGRVVDV